jgi:hypothetical protein
MVRWEQRMVRWERRMDRIDARTANWEARMDRAETPIEAMDKRLAKRLDALAKLVAQGMKMLVWHEARMDELATAQKETRRTLKTFLAGFGNGFKPLRNGQPS